ncbi:MAG TPA: TIGR04283 family arsenosugar biosynthesis glycosyltransferase [Nitrospira sp.]|nr:TIGR04283 family arsenosugar biosynthesis glycosyltransferase [Nitrospira sp.]
MVTISVIIPALNEEKTIRQTLSCLPTAEILEAIIVDGGSTDQTISIAEAFCAEASNARIITAPVGRARQMNEGAKAGRGDILLFLHADTRLPTKAILMIEAALTDPAVVGGRFDVTFDSRSVWGTMISTFMNRRSRLSGIATGDQALFVRRRIFEQLGGFADIPLMEDIEFSRRLKRTGQMAALHQTVTTSFRRWEQQGPLRTILSMWALRFMYWAGVNPTRLSRWYKTVR